MGKSMNTVILMGYVSSEPQYQVCKTGLQMATFILNVSRRYKHNNRFVVDCIPIRCWRGSADLVRQVVRKGDFIRVEGAIHMNTFFVNSKRRRTHTVDAHCFGFFENIRKRWKEGQQLPDDVGADYDYNDQGEEVGATFYSTIDEDEEAGASRPVEDQGDDGGENVGDLNW